MLVRTLSILYFVRNNAFAYIHGHSVGGTNPSLLEALAATKLNLLYDCVFNKEVARDSAIYWNLNNDSLKSVIEKAELLSEDEINKYGNASKEVILDHYKWEFIVSSYEKLFLGKKI